MKRYTRLTGLANTAELRTATFDGVDHIVVPVVCLVGNKVVWPMNATSPEFVPAEELSIAPGGWNGRPVTYDHPNNGTQSANDPRTLERYCFGRIFNAKFEDNKLKCEAWLDPARAVKVGADAVSVIERCRNKQVVEVSVGAWIAGEAAHGEYEGVEYDLIWRDIVPDHLAMLPADAVGACSVDMGCGAPRLNRSGKPMSDKDKVIVNSEGTSDQDIRAMLEPALVKAEGVEYAWVEAVFDTTVVYTTHKDNQPSELLERSYTITGETVSLGNDRKKVRRKVQYEAEPTLARRMKNAVLSAVGIKSAELSDYELRQHLHKVLYAQEPAFESIVEVYPESSTVIYITRPDGKSVWWRCTYKKAKDDSITINDDKEMVEEVIEYKTVNMRDHDCQCHKDKESVAMSDVKRPAVDRLIAAGSFKEDDRKALEAMTDAGLAALEAKFKAQEEEPKPEDEKSDEVVAQTAKPAEMTEEQWLAQAPQSLRAMHAKFKAAEVAQHTALVTSLKAAQSAYTEDELKSMSVDALSKLASALKVDEPTRDYSARNLSSGSGIAADLDPYGLNKSKSAVN